MIYIPPEKAAKLILQLYGPACLSKAFIEFDWKVPEGVKTRDQLETLAESVGPSEDAIFNLFSEVHRWGFNNMEITAKVKDPTLKQKCLALAAAWKNSDRKRKECSFDQLISLNNINIATISKFTAILDPLYAAIYDSRVSLALHEIKTHDKKTIFPTVGRRPFGGRVFPPPSHRITRKSNLGQWYLWYLDVLTEVRKDVPFDRNSDVEKALFMIGQ